MSNTTIPQSAPSTLLTGRLVEATTLEPLVGLTVVVSERTDGDGTILRRGDTDSNGYFQVSLSDSDLRALMADAPTQPLFEATVFLLVWNNEESLGTLSPRIATGPMSKRIDLGDQPVAIPTATRSYTLRARVLSTTASPLVGIEVSLESVSVGQRHPLANGTTDEDGRVSLTYAGGPNSSARDTDRQLQLIARHGGTEVTHSPVLFANHDDQEVRLIATEDPGQGLSELERLQAAIAGPLGTANLGALSLEEIEVLAQQADVYPPHLAMLARATTLAGGASVMLNELYAMGRAGLPLTLAGLLARDGKVYRQALTQAYSRRLIPVPPEGEASVVDSIATRMADWAGAVAIDPDITTPRWSNLERSGVSESTRQAFAAKWVTLTGSLAERWATVHADPALAAAAPVLEFTAGSSILVGEHGPAVQALLDARTAGEVTTLRDLAAWDLTKWTTAFEGMGVPEALVELEPAEATEQLAQIAMRVIDVLHPGAGLARELSASADPALVEASTFLRGHADFDLGRTVLARYHAEHPEAFAMGPVGEAQRATLAKVQRVHALTAGVEKPQVTKALLARGIESAGAVVHLGLDGFVDHHGPALDGVHPFLAGKALAMAIYEQATVRHAATVAMASQFGKAFAGAPMTVLPAMEWSVDLADPASATLRELFGSQDFCACEHCRSVYGPAAYFVDLLALLQSRPAITQDDALEVLRQRRPDLMGLELSCINTNTLMPYVDLLLELLEARAIDPAVAPVVRQTTRTAEELRLGPEHRLDAAYDLVAEAVYPWRLPFDLSAARVRAYCTQLGASRLEAMHTLRARTGPQQPPVMDRVAEALGLTPAALQLVSGATAYDIAELPTTAPTTAWGMVGAGWVTTLSNDVAQVLERSGLDFNPLREHLALESINPGGVVQVVFDEPSCDLDDARLDGLDEATLDRMQRFVRLSRATGLTPIELDRSVRSLGGALDGPTLEALADTHTLAQALGQSLSSLHVLWSAFDTMAYEGAPSPYAQRFQNRVLTPQLDLAFALGISGDELAPGVVLTEAHTPTIRAALSLSDDELHVLLTEVLPPSPLLSIETLSVLARHVRLARLMRLPIAELVVLLALVGSDPFASPSQARSFIDSVRLLHGSGLSTAQLDYLARHRFSADAGLDPSDEAIDGTLASVWAATQAVDSSLEADAITQLYDEALVQVLSAALGLPADATRMLAFELVHENSATAQETILNETFLSDGVVLATQRNAYRRLHKAALVVRTLEVTTTDLAWYFSGLPSDRLLDLDALPLSLTSNGQTHVDGIERVRLGRELQAELSTADNIWEQATQANTIEDAAELLATYSTWNAADLQYAMTDLAGLAPADLREPTTLAMLRDVAALVRRTGVRAQTLAGWVRPRPTAPIADALLAALKARYDDDTWPRVITPIADRLRNAQRKALVAFILGRGDFSDDIALYDHLLVDPQMGACMLTSRLKLATSSVQLFIQRVLMNLEQTDVTFPPATAERWTWMKTYRAWEANRKVFFYPENWIEPELRDDKSPFFEELEQHLQQGELTEEHVEAGYRAYLRKLHAVSHLEVPALCTEQQGLHQVVHVLARTRGLPPKYWYRNRIDDSRWTPWSEVPVDIPGNQVTVATHNRRLFVMWVEAQGSTTKLKKEDDDDTAQDVYQQVRIGWTEYRDGIWSPKKLTPLSTNTTVSAHNVVADDLQIVAYERDGALFVDVLYTFVSLWQSMMFRYDDCRDTLEEVDPTILYENRDLGLANNGMFDGQRHQYQSITDLALIHRDSVGYQDVSVLDDLPERYWLTTAKQRRTYSGRTPVIFDDGHHALYIVPANHWVEVSGPVGISVDPWAVLGGVTMAVSPPDQSSVPSVMGVMPWAGTVPGLNTHTRTDLLSIPSAGALASPGGIGNGSRKDPRDVDPFGVLATTKEILEPLGTTGMLGDKALVPPEADDAWAEVWAYRIDPFHHPYTCPMVSNLNRYGLPGVLTPASPQLRRQAADVAVLASADDEYMPVNVATPYPRDDFDFTTGGAYSVYNWELFVHAPLLIAERLRREQRFEEAQRWFHFVFNPLQGVEPGEDDGPARFWNAKPLHEDMAGGPIDVIKAVMSDEGLDADPALVGNFLKSVLAWVADPFSPHAIARVRAGTYQKAIVRKYLDNLIDWGDDLFRRDTMESVAEATQIYLLAASILGPRPQRLPETDAPVRTYDDLIGPALFGGLTELEGFVPSDAVALPWMGVKSIAAGGGDEAEVGDGQPPPSPLWWAFCLPANEQLLAYWDRVGDRLFKIRHCQNIDGVKRALRLFEPPIDPALLVKAKAMGVDLGSALADLQAPAPRHRFAVLRGRAKELLGDVRGLGGALLSALEKRDAEALGQLRANHEVALLKATRATRLLQIEDAEAQLTGLQRQRATVQARHEYYASREKISPLEQESLALGTKATQFQLASQGVKVLGGLLHLIPNLDLGVNGMIPVVKAIFGGQNIGPAVSMAGDILGMVATSKQHGAQLTSTLAGYQRRQDDWSFQAEQATSELRQLDQQIVASEIRVAITTHELSTHDRQVAHSEEVESFLRTKFTNQDLYDWTVGQLSGLYFQSYKLAHDMARRAERALQFELGRDDLVFIEPAYWDGLRKGLLAGERLALDMRRMEVAQLDHDRRELELTKRISLRQLDPAELGELRETGSCTLKVPEVAFDLDHPGHYFRRIKSVSLSIPAVAGPQVGVSATLSLLSDETRIETSTAPTYERVDVSDTRFKDAWVEAQSIATSHGRDDAGVFELSFRGEKFLPFEGAGAISEWSLELPEVQQFDYRTITDVELELRYTARADHGPFRDAARGSVNTAIEAVLGAGAEGGFVTLLCATKDFATGWERLLRPAEGQEGDPLAIPIGPERFPYVARSRGVVVDSVRLVWIGDPDALTSLADVPFVTAGGATTVTFSTVEGLLEAVVDSSDPAFPATVDDGTGAWSLEVPAGAVVDPDAIHDLWILVQYHVTQ